MNDSFKAVTALLPEPVREEIADITRGGRSEITEIRLRAGQTSSYRVCMRGTQIEKMAAGRVLCDKELINECINKFINYSYYAYEDEMKNGYITLSGGHRVGICGHIVTENGRVHLMRNISSINIRQAREVIGIAAGLAGKITTPEGRIESTLIVSPPRCGKTTLVRDLVRTLSERGYIIGVCDERSEIAGMRDGVPSFDIGGNTDVMDACPKASGMLMLLRSMGPDVIVTDEIGKAEDIEAIESVLLAGVSIIATIHGAGRRDIAESRVAELVEKGIFRNIVFLSNRPRIGSIKQIVHINEGRMRRAYD